MSEMSFQKKSLDGGQLFFFLPLQSPFFARFLVPETFLECHVMMFR